MSTHAIDRPQRPRKAKAVQMAHVGTHGLGAQERDFESFLHMDQIEQARQIREGMEAVIISRIASELLNIPLQSLLTSLRLPSSTINRKISSGERLSASESDRAARTVLIYAQAKDVLEDGKLAAEWLQRPSVELRGERPLDMLDTQTGFDRVRDVLVRLEHGVGV
ncbi:type II RES/Xre toxin-antitoxin system antitoxin [Collimonas antrihumi]|uniref:type II RES/Xre toxin-antitoxin system antitoxin n=1 Tax=Collimonas antrihumi TaxID=1940615 RepID=UPI001B8BF1A6|nr:antitoxin Xre/MbcA/ParS toxin-binding domain-containing protein [Collimonas antrihumi]